LLMYSPSWKMLKICWGIERFHPPPRSRDTCSLRDPHIHTYHIIISSRIPIPNPHRYQEMSVAVSLVPTGHNALSRSCTHAPPPLAHLLLRTRCLALALTHRRRRPTSYCATTCRRRPTSYCATTCRRHTLAARCRPPTCPGPDILLLPYLSARPALNCCYGGGAAASGDRYGCQPWGGGAPVLRGAAALLPVVDAFATKGCSELGVVAIHRWTVGGVCYHGWAVLLPTGTAFATI
jgi:hypothetical protein